MVNDGGTKGKKGELTAIFHKHQQFLINSQQLPAMAKRRKTRGNWLVSWIQQWCSKAS